MNEPLISVAMATYNGENFLRKQLDSIFNQTYKNIELIVCDDCSQDSTVQILNEYASKHPNMKVFVNEKNLGYIKNFEKAISLCSGEYISISDQDDIWLEDKIEFLYNEIGDFDVICSKEGSIDENDEPLPNTTYAERRFKLSKTFKFDDISLLKIINMNILAGCTSLIKTDFIKSVMPFPLEFAYDGWLCINAFCNNSLKFVDRITILHRKHCKNVSVTKKKTNILTKYENIPDELKRLYKMEEYQLDVLKSRINLSEDYIKALDKYYAIKASIRNFKFSFKDFYLIFEQFKLNRKLNLSLKHFLATVIKRFYH